MREQENIKKIFSYKNTEEKQQELEVDLVESSKTHKVKMWTLRLLVIAVFAFLCFEKVYNDFTYGTACWTDTGGCRSGAYPDGNTSCCRRRTG